MKKLAITILLILFLCIPAIGQIKPMLGTQLNRVNSSTKGLVGFWYMNEVTGNIVQDLSGNNNTGTFVSNPLWVPGTLGSAIDFSDDAINVGGSVYNGCVNELTIVVKLRHDGGGADFGRIIDKYPGPSLHITTSDNWFRFYGEIGGLDYDQSWEQFTWTPGISYTVAFRLGSNFQELYVDGVLADVALEEGPYAGTYDIGSGVDAYIGNRVSDMDKDFDGLIEYMYIYNRALSAGEIALLYQKSPSAFVKRDYTSFWGSTLGNGISIIPLITAIKNQ